MNEAIPGGFYRRSDELAPLARIDIFNPDGSLSDIGLTEVVRISKILLDYCHLPEDAIPDKIDQWKHNQWMELQEPGYLKRHGFIHFIQLD